MSSLKFSECIILLGYDKHFKNDTVLDIIILEAKVFIYRCKLAKKLLNLKAFVKNLNVRYQM